MRSKGKGGRGGDRVVEEARRARSEWDSGYRGQALKVLPWVCAKCGREFSGKNLRDLTVHHKDHDHRNNPPDGSNWELLCNWCHDDEHSRRQVAEAYGTAKPGSRSASSTYRPFADLDKLLKRDD